MEDIPLDRRLWEGMYRKQWSILLVVTQNTDASGIGLSIFSPVF